MAGKVNHRGFGHTRKLPSKRWQASYIGPDLERHTAPATFDTGEDAAAWLRAEHTLISNDGWTPPKLRRKLAGAPLTFGEYAESWMADRVLKPRTRTHYRSILAAHILPTFQATPLTAITPAAVRRWHTEVAVGRPTTRAHAYALLRTILGTALTDEEIATNPCHIRGAGSAKRRIVIKTPTVPQLEKLVTAMPDKYRLMVLLAAWCALRFGELTELRRKDVNLRDGVIHVRRGVTWVDSKPVIGTPKSDAGTRDVAIPPHLLPAIKAHVEQHAQWGRDGLLFPSPQGTNLTTSTLYASYWPARKKAGLPTLRFHDLRHAGATWAAREGATLADLMQRLGHSTPSAAMRYQHSAAGRDAELARALSKLAEGHS